MFTIISVGKNGLKHTPIQPDTRVGGAESKMKEKSIYLKSPNAWPISKLCGAISTTPKFKKPEMGDFVSEESINLLVA